MLINLLSYLRTSQLFWIFSFTILTAIAAQIIIPVKPVPFTLQTMVVLLAGALLGPKNGAYSQLIYIGLGAIGLPVFAHTPDAGIGFARLFGPTGGYLLAFPFAAYMVGYLVQKNKSYFGVVLSMFAGNILIIIAGTLFLYLFYLHNFSDAIAAGAAIFTVWMVIKVFAAATIYFGISKKYETLP
jgi:biotin transport system substrate-specific component